MAADLILLLTPRAAALNLNEKKGYIGYNITYYFYLPPRLNQAFCCPHVSFVQPGHRKPI